MDFSNGLFILDIIIWVLLFSVVGYGLFKENKNRQFVEREICEETTINNKMEDTLKQQVLIALGQIKHVAEEGLKNSSGKDHLAQVASMIDNLVHEINPEESKTDHAETVEAKYESSGEATDEKSATSTDHSDKTVSEQLEDAAKESEKAHQ